MPFSTRNLVIAPVKRMCHGCIINKKTNRLHERYLRIIYGDRRSAFEELLEKDSIQILATKMYKVSKVMSPPQITELFEQRNERPCNLRHNAEFLKLFENSVYCGTESILSDTYENIDSL